MVAGGIAMLVSSHGANPLGVVLVAAYLLLLRRKHPDRPRPYRMWGYPLTLVLFLAVAVGFIVNTFLATPGPAISTFSDH